MINRDLTHTGSDGSEYYQRIEATGYPLVRADSAENIAQGYPTPAEVVNGETALARTEHPTVRRR